MVYRYERNYMTGHVEQNVFEIRGTSDEYPGTHKPTILDKLPLAEGSSYFELDTLDIYFYDGKNWHLGQGETPILINTPVDSMSAAGGIGFDIEFASGYEYEVIGGKEYKIPIYHVENTDPIHATEATNKAVTIALNQSAQAHVFKIVVDGTEVNTLTFTADLTQQVKVFMYQQDEEPTMGACLYIDCDIIPDQATIVSGELSDEAAEEAEIMQFEVNEGNQEIKLNTTNTESADYYAHNVVLSKTDYDLYIGIKDTGQTDYVYQIYNHNAITKDNGKYRLMAVPQSHQPLEDEWRYYDLVFYTPANKENKKQKKRKINIFGRKVKKKDKGGK